MIKLDYYEDVNFRKWYSETILEIIEKNRKNFNPDQSISDFSRIIEKLSYEDIKKIILCSRQELETYEWILEYLKLADFVSHYSEFRSLCERENLKSQRIDNLSKYDGKYLKTIHKNAINEYSTSWKRYDALKKEATDLLDNMNAVIGQVINYDFTDTSFRRELFLRMDVRVCPYCNQQYIPMTGDGKYLGDFDHVLPKKYYQLFSLSLWNLVPSCKACNQSLKRDNARDILNPTQYGFEKEAIFKVKCDDISSIRGESDFFEYGWEIQNIAIPINKQKIKNNIEIFHLNDKDETRKKKNKRHIEEKVLF